MKNHVSRRTAVRAGGTALLGTLAGCFEDLFGGADERHVPAELRPEPGVWVSSNGCDLGGNLYNPHAAPPTSEPALAWAVDYEQSSSWPGFSIADGTIFLRTRAALTAFDAEDGAERWAARHEEGGYVFYVDGRLYHGTAAFEQALTPGGEVEWEIDDPVDVVGEAGDRVYTSTDDELAWYDARSGRRLGSIDVGSRCYGVVDGIIYGFADDAVFAYEHDGDEPTPTWETPVEGSFEIPNFLTTVADWTLHVYERGGPREKRLGRYDLRDGSFETTGRTYGDIYGFVLADGVEYATTQPQSEEGRFGPWTLTARDGEVLWERSFDTIPWRPVVAGDVVLLGGDDHELLALDAESGETLWVLSDFAGWLAVVDDTVYVFQSERLLALR